MFDRRVVITGIGVLSPIGIGKEAFWQALIEGKNGIRPVTAFDTSDYPCHYGGQVWDFDPNHYLSPQAAARMGEASQFAVTSAKMALDDAGIEGRLDPERTGVALGSTNCEVRVIEKLGEIWNREGYEQTDPEFIAKYPPQLIPANVAIELEVEGPVVIMPNACAAGNWAIGCAF